MRRASHLSWSIEAHNKVDALDIAIGTDILMPAVEFAFVCVEFFHDAVINNENGILILDFSDSRFDKFPQFGRCEINAWQKACDFVVADRSFGSTTL